MSGLRLPPRRAALEWSAAALAAAALLFAPWLVVLLGSGRPESGRDWVFGFGAGLAALAVVVAHARLQRQPVSALLSAVAAGALNALAWVAFIILVLVGGSCEDNGHIPVWAWPVAALIYLAGGTFGLRKRWHALWLVPLSALVAGGWIVLMAKLVTGSTGACID